MLNKGCRMYNGYKRKKNGWSDFNVSNMYKSSHITLLITFRLDLKVIKINLKGILWKK